MKFVSIGVLIVLGVLAARGAEAASPITNTTPLNASQVVTSGTPVVAILAGPGIVFNGCWIQNDPNATTYIVVDSGHTASAANPSPTASFVFPGDKWTCPGALVNKVTVDAPDNGHKFYGTIY